MLSKRNVSGLIKNRNDSNSIVMISSSLQGSDSAKLRYLKINFSNKNSSDLFLIINLI